METKEIKKVYVIRFCGSVSGIAYLDIEDATREAYNAITAEARKRHKLKELHMDDDGRGWYFFTRADVYTARVLSLTVR